VEVLSWEPRAFLYGLDAYPYVHIPKFLFDACMKIAFSANATLHPCPLHCGYVMLVLSYRHHNFLTQAEADYLIQKVSPC
jgi:hypothetical protein